MQSSNLIELSPQQPQGRVYTRCFCLEEPLGSVRPRHEATLGSSPGNPSLTFSTVCDAAGSEGGGCWLPARGLSPHPPEGCGAGRWHPWVRWVGEPRGARGGVTLGRSALSAGASEGLGKEQPEGRSRGEGEGRWARGSQPRGPTPSSAPAPFPPSSASLGHFPWLRCRQEAAPSAPPSRNSGPTCSPPLLERAQRQLRASLFPPSCCRAGKRPQHTPCPAPTPPLLPRWAPAGHPRGAAGSRGTGWGSERGAAGACPARLLTPCSFFLPHRATGVRRGHAARR